EGRPRGDRTARHRGRPRRAPRGRVPEGACGMTISVSDQRALNGGRTGRAPSQEEARTLRVVVVNGSPSEKSKTVGLVDVVLQTLTSALAVHDVAVEHTRIDVYRLGPAFTGAVE